MLKSDIGHNAGVVWNLLHKDGRLTIRQIGEKTSYRESKIHLALGWLARENKIHFFEEHNTVYIGLAEVFPEIYY